MLSDDVTMLADLLLGLNVLDFRYSCIFLAQCSSCYMITCDTEYMLHYFPPYPAENSISTTGHSVAIVRSLSGLNL